MTAYDAASRELAEVQALAGAPRDPRLGCSLVSHKTLGFCAFCPVGERRGVTAIDLEVNAWRLLEIRRGLA